MTPDSVTDFLQNVKKQYNKFINYTKQTVNVNTLKPNSQLKINRKATTPKKKEVMDRPGDTTPCSKTLKGPNPYEPTYWHIGDSPPTPTIKKTVPGLQERPDTINRVKLKLQDIQDAHTRIKDDIVCTPVVDAKYVGNKFCKVIFKCDNLQNTGSFKARGACNVLASLTLTEKCKGVTLSGGRNFLVAMTAYGHKLSVPMNVVVPKDCPLSEKHQLKENFAIVKHHGSDINEASLHAMTYSDQINSKYIHGSDRLDLMAGYGTMGLEILSQVENLDAVICPVGSGGLIASLIISIKSLKPRCAIYAVESASCPTLTRALQENKPVQVQAKPSTADSLSHNIASSNAFNVIRGYLHRIITVDETWIVRALITMLEREKMLIEGAAACPVAAILADKVPELRGKTVMCILSGGNINSLRVGRVIERGLAAEGRLVKFTVKLADAPGAIAKLMNRVTNLGADVRSFVPERAWMRRDIATIAINMVIETTDLRHAQELEKELMKNYPNSNLIIV